DKMEFETPQVFSALKDEMSPESWYEVKDLVVTVTDHRLATVRGPPPRPLGPKPEATYEVSYHSIVDEDDESDESEVEALPPAVAPPPAPPAAPPAPVSAAPATTAPASGRATTRLSSRSNSSSSSSSSSSSDSSS